MAPVGFRWWKGTAWDGWDDGTDELPRWSEGLRGHTVRIILKKPIQVVRTSAAKRHRVCVCQPLYLRVPLFPSLSPTKLHAVD